MRVPYRKPGKFSQLAPDPMITQDKFTELENKLKNLEKIQPQAAADVARLAQLGDFSENAEYQLAKGRLRGINNSILRLKHQLNQAIIIAPLQQTKIVQIGSLVTILLNQQKKTYQILGSVETDPKKGIISHNSPIGAALIGHQAGETIEVKLAGKETECRIIKIE